MSQLMNEVAEEVKSRNFSSIEKLRKFGRVFLGGTEICSQEAAYTNSGIPLSRCSRGSIFINTGPPSERVVIVKSAKQLQEMSPDSTDVTVKGLLDHYSQRPLE